MRTLAFVQAHIGSYLTAPGGAGRQCVDLVNVYLVDAFRQLPIQRNGVDWSTVSVPGFTWTPNTPLNAPPVGSLVVWGPYAKHSISEYGHIALALVADTMTLLTFDQDWPIGAACQLTLHDYGGVLGWHQLAG